MKTKAIVLVAFMLASSPSLSVAGKTGANAKTETSAEARAKAAYDAARKAARAAEAAVVPLRIAMQKAETAYANATKAANAKRQQATNTKNLAGEVGVKELKKAEANVPVSIKILADAIKAKPVADKALAAAKAAALPLQQAYDKAQKAADEAQAAAKIASDAANKLYNEARRTTVRATARRRKADAAKSALTRARQDEQRLRNQADNAPKKLAEAEMQKKAADAALVKTGKRMADATTAYQAAEKAALAAEANARVFSKAQVQQAAAQAVAKRKAVDAAKIALTRAQQNEQQARTRAAAAGRKLAGAPAHKRAADDALVNASTQVALAVTASQAAEQTALRVAARARRIAAGAGKSETEKKRAVDEASAWRKAADAARAALAKTQQGEKTAQVRAEAAAKTLATAAAQKKSADAALAGARKQVTVAATALQTAEQASQKAQAAARAMASHTARPEQQKRQAAADAAGKRKEADAAGAVLAKAQGARRQSQKLVNVAVQKLHLATVQKKLVDTALANVRKQVVSCAATWEAAEKTAREFEKVAAGKRHAAAQAVAKRKAVAATAAALTEARQGEQKARNQANTAQKAVTAALARKKLADGALANARRQVAAATKSAAKSALAKAKQGEKTAQAQVTAAGKKLTEAQAQKKLAIAALTGAKTKTASANNANQTARAAAGELIQLDAERRQAAAQLSAKRKTAYAARMALAPKQKALEQAVIQVNAAAQNVTRAQARKKSAEEYLVNLKKRIASAKRTHLADERAAKAAEALAAPLKVKAEKPRAAYVAASKIADKKRQLAEQAKTVLYRMVAARELAGILESSDPPKPANGIDEIIFAKLKALGIKPVLCSDAVFLRRAFLDLTGKLPRAREAKAFIQSTNRKKRAALIDRLLERSAHVDYWAMKWSDILRVKAEFPVKVWPNAAQAYYRWIWESIARNKPYDRFAREMLTSSGSNYRVGPVNFYRAIQNKTPEGIASSVGLVFMGVRVHAWSKERRADMALFFSQVGYKPTSEWKEEIVFWDPLHSTTVTGSIAPGISAVAKSVTATNRIPRALAKPLSENRPLAVVFPDGAKTTIRPNRDPREVFTDWLIQPKNPWFAKAIVNRTWAWAMGRGIIHEPDDIRKDNPPGNPALLACLEKELVSSGYDLKHLKRLIFTSTAYQFSSIPRFKGPEAKANFAHSLLRRVEAEVLIDALNEITGSSDLYTSAVPEPFTYIPKGVSAVALADGSITSSFLSLFGRSARATGMENERINELASTQWLHMLNSATIQRKLQSGPKLAALISAGGKPREIAERLYLTILSRFPTDADIKSAEEYAKSGVTKGRNVWIDLAWALINSPEFLLRH